MAMQKRTSAAWTSAALYAVFVVSFCEIGCFQLGQTDSGKEEADAGPALGSFCNSVTQGDSDATSILRLQTDTRQIDLPAKTGTCNTGLDDACSSIPIGDNVSIEVLVNNSSVLSDSIKIQSGKEYGFYLTVDKDTLPVLFSRDLTDESSVCSNNECDFYMYTANTCQPSDPCEWANDGECDDACLNQTPTMFDDSQDCTTAAQAK
jgi:hypothetical protein